MPPPPQKTTGGEIWADPNDPPEWINLTLEEHTDYTDAHEQMYEHISFFQEPEKNYKKIYTPDPDSRRCFKNFPKAPTMEDIETTIDKSPSSAPGPDGIPFPAYRYFSKIATKLIKNIMDTITKGAPPPSNFNISKLYMETCFYMFFMCFRSFWEKNMRLFQKNGICKDFSHGIDRFFL